MKYLLQILLPGVVMLAVLFGGCVKQPETIVIDQEPATPDTTVSAKDTVASRPAAADANFKQLVIGENQRISTLDPLFADNNSIRRTLQILYEGLVRFDRNGEIVPAISKRWSISDDSLTYRFTLRDDVFFHDSDIFNSGIGRKVVASDFKYALERMAKINVPADAAQLFMSVRGFEPYFKEQHNVLNPAYREFSGASGIAAPNDSTLVIALIEKDRHLLQKLATPYAVLYPREAVASSPGAFAPVGSGPFQLSQRRGDSTYIFSKYKEYWNAENSIPIVDRVDVTVERREPNLFRGMAEENIHLIPEMGPRILESVMFSSTELQPAYRDNYRLTVPGGSTTYSLNFNPDAGESAGAVQSLFAGLDFLQLLSGIPSGLISDTYLVSLQEKADDAATVSLPLYSTFSEDPYQQWILSRISRQLGGEPAVRMLRIRTPSRQTALYNRSFVPFYDGHAPERNRFKILQYSVKQSALAIREIEQLEFNRYPWWINLRSVDLPGIDQL